MSIEGIDLEHFCATDQGKYSSHLYSCTHHAVFHLFIYDNRKQYADTTDSHSKLIIEMLKNKNVSVLVSVIYGRI